MPGLTPLHFSNFESKFTKMHGLTSLHFSNFKLKFTKMRWLTLLHFSNFESKFTKLHGLTSLYFSKASQNSSKCIGFENSRLLKRHIVFNLNYKHEATKFIHAIVVTIEISDAFRV